MERPLKEIVMFSDGACQINPGPGGYGVVLIAGGRRQEFRGGFRKTTNNRMELYSVIRGLREIGDARCKVTIYSDSQYVVNMVNGGYAREWQKNGWRRNRGRDAALNPDLWQELLDRCARHNVEFVWVKGHSENKENDRCDELAVESRQAPDLPVDEGYETPAAPKGPRQLMLFEGV
jgi:ribonuclease HI